MGSVLLMVNYIVNPNLRRFPPNLILIATITAKAVTPPLFFFCLLFQYLVWWRDSISSFSLFVPLDGSNQERCSWLQKTRQPSKFSSVFCGRAKKKFPFKLFFSVHGHCFCPNLKRTNKTSVDKIMGLFLK